MLKKQIDAAVLWPPIAYNLKKNLGEKAISWSVQSEQAFFWLAITTENQTNEKREALKKFIEGLSKSEMFLQENEMRAKQIVATYLNMNNSYMEYYWPKQRFTIELPQSLLLRLEDEARWKIKSKLITETKIPNYLAYISSDILKLIKPNI